MSASGLPTSLAIALPDWVAGVVGALPPCRDDAARMRVAIALAGENVARASGGPFGAAVFLRGAPRPLAVGVNCVQRLNNAVLHAEVMALMLAQARLGAYTLRAPGGGECELFTSCAPCAMCLGAALWSGVRRIVCAAAREDAQALGFDEGPVFPESYRYLAARGIALEQGLLAADACAVMQRYRERGGEVYNA